MFGRRHHYHFKQTKMTIIFKISTFRSHIFLFIVVNNDTLR